MSIFMIEFKGLFLPGCSDFNRAWPCHARAKYLTRFYNTKIFTNRKCETNINNPFRQKFNPTCRWELFPWLVSSSLMSPLLVLYVILIYAYSWTDRVFVYDCFRSGLRKYILPYKAMLYTFLFDLPILHR